MVALNAVHQNFHDADIDYVHTGRTQISTVPLNTKTRENKQQQKGLVTRLHLSFMTAARDYLVLRKHTSLPGVCC